MNYAKQVTLCILAGIIGFIVGLILLTPIVFSIFINKPTLEDRVFILEQKCDSLQTQIDFMVE